MAISRNQRSRGNQRRPREGCDKQWSVAISGNQSQSVAISRNRSQSVAISRNQWPSAAISATVSSGPPWRCTTSANASSDAPSSRSHRRRASAAAREGCRARCSPNAHSRIASMSDCCPLTSVASAESSSAMEPHTCRRDGRGRRGEHVHARAVEGAVVSTCMLEQSRAPW